MNAPLFRIDRVTRRVQRELAGCYPMLSVRSSAHRTLVTGDFPVVDELGEFDRFSIEIECDRRYPKSIPTVREMAGRIPVDLDRHVLSDGTFCLFHPEYYWQAGFHRKQMQAFLDGPVRSFFIYQLCIEQGVKWPHGELDHGDPGALKFLDDMFGTPRTVTIRMIRGMAKGVTRHTPCPCGSGRATRNCHQACLALLATRGARERMRGLAGRVTSRSLKASAILTRGASSNLGD